MGSIREVCSDEGINGGNRIYKEIPEEVSLAEDLKAILEND